ncbi:crotonase/enoyl-CoA hydratase family protein [Aquisalimonas lutea]|uniref:crotonase/enoyl-CoA hydratase family protein n=1 Tax=Aquisalimonas lutea TaxID=1327750 RepID=UPI0025B5342D|nr:crotonase/enoyl-CoA hydratase family protein [Aquisalimonas lutea]MDN3518785.1 crotonase/enoyl-CoA hydratase family protein [Aquisalimonas lutea]
MSGIRVEKDGPVTTVILDRRHARNAVDPDTARALYRAFLDFDADPDASVAVFCGDHGTFCAGADLKAVSSGALEAYLGELDPPEDAAEVTGSPAPMGPSRLLLSKPVIAAVSGHAVAGGMELALWCDLRVMEETAAFGVYCRRWGVPLIDGGTVRLPQIIGLGRAMDLILTGRRVDADEAHAMGLCNRVVPEGGARAAAEELARELARFPQLCMRMDRASAYAQHGQGVGEALRHEYRQGLRALREEGVAGASRFASGQGRHGDFDDL